MINIKKIKNEIINMLKKMFKLIGIRRSYHNKMENERKQDLYFKLLMFI